jgi:hypothetical protein
MAAIDLLAVPTAGTEYSSFDDLEFALHDWAVKEKFSFRIVRKEARSSTYVCAAKGTTGCTWRCNGTSPAKGMCRLSIQETEHICMGAPLSTHRSSSRREWLDGAIARHMRVARATKPEQIIDMLPVQFAEHISYKVAQEARLRALGDDIQRHRESFELLPAYERRLLDACPGAYIDLVIDLRTERFTRIFVAPPTASETFRLCRRFVGVDGTFLKGKFVQTLLLAVGIDANGHNVLLAWAVVESENRSSWEWFFRHLRRVLVEITTEPSTFVSDRDKGLLEAERVLGPHVVVAWCCHHLKDNFCKAHGKGLAPHFWSVARAKTGDAYERALSKMAEVKPSAAQWCRDHHPERWVEALFVGRRYGHDTSNIVESLNGGLKLERELPTIELLDSLWHRAMEQRSERLAAALSDIEHNRLWTSWATGLLLTGKRWAMGHTTQLSTPLAGRVMEADGRIILVDLVARSCECHRFQSNSVPCGHALSVIYRQQLSVADYMPEVLSTATWRATYHTPLPPVSILGLAAADDDVCSPPMTRVPRGRPKKERIRLEESRARRGATQEGIEAPLPLHLPGENERRRCGTCGEDGHNSRTRIRPHV